MNKITVLIAIVVILLIGGVLYAKTSKNSPATPAATSSTQNSANPVPASTAVASGAVMMKNMAFTPPQITVHKGATVTWTNNDSVAHTVIDDLAGKGPASGTIEPGGTYSYTFTATGSFQYHCSIHPSMRGTIVVQ